MTEQLPQHEGNGNYGDKRDWKAILAQVKRDELPALQRIGIEHPTVRQVYYRLVSKEMIPNTKSSYTYLDKVLAEARMKGAVNPDDDGDVNNGRLNPDTFSDESRAEAQEMETRTPEQFIDDEIKAFKSIEKYYNPSIWIGQDYYVEVWIEKQALESTFNGILQDKDMVVVSNRGYNSTSALQQSASRLAGMQYSHKKKIVILYFGDHDPSGLYMDRDLDSRLRELGLRNFEFRRVGLTLQQIIDYELPADPDIPTKDKLDKDSRKRAFINRFQTFRGTIAELDALAIRENEFKQLVIDAVDGYYNPGLGARKSKIR